ncbi:MAG: hypothetical protein HYY78_14560 [Betaproteobacteria bacterium]|nr:hypothetical protein [Betaproteobacteria bacterium]
MTFRQAVEATPEIANSFRAGLRALREVDRQRIAAQRPRALRGSVDLDNALAETYPNARRWDYAIGVEQTRCQQVYWAEVHPARDDQIAVMREKLEWLKQWLRDSAVALNNLPREFVWVSSGATAITPNSPKLRALAVRGLVFKGGHFRIP